MNPLDMLAALHLTPSVLFLIYAALWLASALAHAMPEPLTTSPWWYITLHNLLQLFAANLTLIKFPNSAIKDEEAPKP